MPDDDPDPQSLPLFRPLVGDASPRDDRQAMRPPLVSLTKDKRTTAITWRSGPEPDADWVRVSASSEHGIAHIWDYDVLIWLMSKLNEAIDRGEEVSPRIVATPSEILTGIGRSNGGGDCADLVAAPNCLSALWSRRILG